MADDYAGDETTTGILPVNGSVRGKIDDAADRDWFRLDLKPGAAYQFSVQATDATVPLIYVYDKTHVPYVMYTNDPVESGYALSTPFSQVEVEKYFLWIKSDHPLDYTIGVREVADDHLNLVAAAMPIAVGGSAGARFDYTGDEEYFRIAAVQGSTYKVRLSADTGALPAGAAVQLYGASGWTDVTYTTEGGALVMNLTADQTRTYYFKADAGLDTALAAPLQYHVSMTGSVRQIPVDDYAYDAPALALPLNGSAAARLDYPGDSEYFRIAAVAGTTYTFRLTADSGALPAKVSIWSATPVMGPDTKPYMDGNAMVFKVTADRTGALSIGVRAESDSPVTAPVPYHLSATAADATGPQLTSAKGTIDGVLTLSFNEPVQRGSGTVELLNQFGKVVGAWDGSSSAITVNGSSIAIDPGHVLPPGEYSLRVNGAAVTDLSGNALNAFSRSQPVNLSSTSDGGHAARPFRGAADGMGPNDTGVLEGRLEDFKIIRNGHYTIAEGLDGSFTYTDIERLMFTQSDDVIVLAPTAAVSQAWRLYQAAFDRVPDKGGLGYWLYQQEHGTSLQAMADRFLASPEFTAKYGASPGNADFVASLYHNVLHRDGEAAGLAYHIGNLERGVSRADVLAGFSESPENQAAVASLIGNGFAYTPYG